MAQTQRKPNRKPLGNGTKFQLSDAGHKAGSVTSSKHAASEQPQPAPNQATDEHPNLADTTTTDQPTSRLCVKNLPKYLTEAKLKEHFSAKGEVTDVKIVRTRDGQSRQMGFVGFKTVQDAEVALKYFNRTFIDAMRITTEFARKYKDASLARPWSKHSEGSSAHNKLVAAAKEVDGSASEATALAARLAARANKDGKGKQKKGVLAELEADDPKLAEFLALMTPHRRAKIWANDELAPQQTLQDLMANKDDPEGKPDDADIGNSSDEEYQDLPGAGQASKSSKRTLHLPGGLGARSDDKDDVSDQQDMSEDDEEGDEQQTGAKAADPVVISEGVSDLEYLKSRMTKWNDDDDDDDFARDDSAFGKEDGEQQKDDTMEDIKQQQQDMEEDEDAIDDEQQGDTHGKPATSSEIAVQQHEAGHDPHAPIPDPETAIRATSRLFIRNLAYSATEADLMDLAGGFGDVSSVHLVMDRETKSSKGIAYVQYVMPDDAVKAYKELDGQIFQGRLLHVLPAKAPPSAVVGIELGSGAVVVGNGLQGAEERSAAGSSYKAAQEEKRKADAGNRSAWNSLFMRPDTVQDAVAAHYGVSKSELLDARSGQDIAVRVALGEAAVIQQTKTALAEQGVNVECLEAAAAAGGKAAASKSNVARSPTVLLIKNLPYSTTEEALMSLLSKSGPVARLVLPPSHTLALAEFCEPQDARTAFKALAYKKFQHVPLYLEWAPRDIFNTPAPGRTAAATNTTTQQAPAAAAGGQQDGQQQQQQQRPVVEAKTGSVAMDVDDGDATQGSCTIYVKNLAFTTNDAALKKHFDKVVSAAGGVLHSARVSKRKHPSTGELLSAGFGFVEVDSPEVAAAVITQLQNSLLDHHKLSLQLSKRKEPSAAAAAKASKASTNTSDSKPKKGSGGTKLVVRNVAFEATRKDIMGLFSPFGHLKSCRLPKKFDGNHRGFAFIEFTTKQEARNAFEGVSGTHLYGRRLVVEYAEDDEGLDELRAKTANKYRGDEEAELLAGPAAKRLKKNL